MDPENQQHYMQQCYQNNTREHVMKTTFLVRVGICGENGLITANYYNFDRSFNKITMSL
jgi:hypothetical protein